MMIKKAVRFTAAVLTLLILCAIVPAAAYAEGELPEITKSYISYEDTPIYTGEELTVTPTLTNPDNETLTEGVDYEVSGNKGTDYGKYTFTVEGKGDYTGTVECPFYIAKRFSGTAPYNGYALFDITEFSNGANNYSEVLGARYDPSGIVESAIPPEFVGEKVYLKVCLNGDREKAGSTAVVTVQIDDSYRVIAEVTSIIPYVTVTFDPNGGGDSMDPKTVEKGKPYALPECGFTAPDGKKFDTWDQGKPGKIIKPEEDSVITALWTDLEKYNVTVTYDFNDEGATDNVTDTRTFLENEAPIFTAIEPVERKCHDFTGWGYEDQLIKAGAKFNASADMTLTAQWKLKPLKTYTVIFDANGGKNAPGPQTGESRCGEAAITLSDKVPKNGSMQFAGWSLSRTEPKPILQPGGVAIVNDQFPTITLYAVWIDPEANPHTGDGSDAGIWAAMLTASAICAGAAAGIIIRRKKNE